MSPNIFLNVFTSFLALATNVVVGLLLMPFTIRHLGLTGFGIWMLANTLVGYMGLLDVGLAPTLVKKTAELLARNDSEGLNRTISAFFVLYLVLGGLVAVLVTSLSFVSPHMFNVPAESIHEFQAVLWILGLQVAVSFPMSIWVGLLGGLQAYQLRNVIAITTGLTKAVGTVLLLRSGFGLISLIWLGFALTVTGWLVARFWAKRRLPYLQIEVSRVAVLQLKDIARFSGVMFIGGLSWKTLAESPRIIIGLFQPIASVTIYEAGLSISLYTRHLFFVNAVIMPSAAHLDAIGDKAKLQTLFLSGTKYLFAVYSALVVALIMIGKEFVSLWLGKGFEESVLLMDVLLLGNLYQSQNVIAYYLLIGMNNLRELNRIAIVYPFLNISLSIMFVIQWGLMGVALATAITILVVETYFLLRIVNVFKVSLRAFLRACLLPAAFPLLAGAISIYLIRSVVDVKSWFGLILALMLFGATWVVFFYGWGLNQWERSKLKEKASELLSKHKPCLN